MASEPTDSSVKLADPQYPQTISDLARMAGRWDSEFSERPPQLAGLLEVSDHGIRLGAEFFGTDQNTRNRLFQKAGAPAGYVSTRNIDVQAAVLQQHLHDGDFGSSPKVVMRGRELFTLERGDLIELSHSEVLNAVANSLGNAADGLLVSRIERTEGQLQLNMVSPAKAVEVRTGDVLQAGLHIRHCRYSNQATQIHAFVYRLVCRNGMTRRECVSAQGIVRTRKLSVNHLGGKELLLDQIRRLTTRTWERLEPQLQELRAIRDRPADVKVLLRQWLQRARVSARAGVAARNGSPSRTVMDRLIAAWKDEGAEDTYYAAVNALTRIGSHDFELTPRQRSVLSILGGLLAFSGAHICPRCFSVLSDSAFTVREELGGLGH